MDPRYEENQQPPQSDDVEANNIEGQQIVTDDLGAAQETSEIEFDDFKLACQQAILSIRKGKEPIYQLQTICDAINDAAQKGRMGRDTEFAEYLNQVGTKIMPSLARERSVDDDYLKVVADVMESWVTLFLGEAREKRFNENFVCALTWCFQPNCNLHQTYFQFTTQEFKEIALQHQTWRKELELGSQVDVEVGQPKFRGWMLGTVTQVTGDFLQVEFPNSSQEYDRLIDRWSMKLAPAGQNTKKDYEWRQDNLVNCVDYVVDAWDNQEWLEATIFETREQEVAPGRVVLFGYVAYRVYRTGGKKQKQDVRGIYDGWSSKYDEWIPIISPLIAPRLTKSQGVTKVKQEDDDDLDAVIKPMNGFERVYACPRIQTCLSKRFLYLMDKFGNSGGFDVMLDTIQNQKIDENLNLTTLGYMITLISMPSKLWHRQFLEEYGNRFCDAIIKRLLEAEDSKIRDVDVGCVYQAQVAVQMIKDRIMPRGQAKKETEDFKLKFIKKTLESQFLEKRIQAMKDLNEVVQEYSQQGIAEDTQELIEWINKNEVFSLIWDPKKTHIQLVQRSGDLFRMLLKENILSQQLLEQFWNLTKSDYKQEIFKILNDVDFLLDQSHIEYFFSQITQTTATKLGVEEFDILSMLGRRAKISTFQGDVSNYFWQIITDSADYDQEILDCCVTKFAEMIKYWSIALKKPYFEQLSVFLQSSQAPTIPVLRFFQKIFIDHQDRERSSMSVSQGNNTTGINYGNVPKWVNSQSTEPVECRKVFDEIEESSNFSSAILQNLASYFSSLEHKRFDNSLNRKQLKLASHKYTHQEEVDERLKFLQTFAANSSFEVTKVQLKIMYDQLSGSPVKGDLEEFLKWCKRACENLTDRIVDLNQVGEFFSEQISQKILDLKSMPATGFHFIQMFYVSSNIDANMMHKKDKPKKAKKKKQSEWNNFYGNLWDEPEQQEIQDDEDDKETLYFLVMGDPSKLVHLNMIWSIVLESEVEEVYTPAIDLLVDSYLSTETNSSSEEQRYAYLQILLNKCFELINPESNVSSHIINRVTQIIKAVIQKSEQKGTVGIRPHCSILKGELLDKIVIKYMGQKNAWGEERVERAFVVKVFTSCTLWEFKSEIANILGLAPKYVEFEFPGKKIIDDKQNGTDMKQLGLKLNDIITARKVSINEYIPQAALVDPETDWLVPKAQQIFSEWFDMFKNPVTKKMDNYSVARFITKTTKRQTISTEQQVSELIRSYDEDQDGMLTLQDFLKFYYDAAYEAGDKRQACFKNLKNLNIRPDLVKISEVVDQAMFSKANLMPRFSLQANDAQYQTLWNLLDRNDDTCAGTWDIIRMLATNDKQYMQVISMDNVTNDLGEVDWATFFKGTNIYQKDYLQEIILSVLEDSEQSKDDVKRVMFVKEQKQQNAGYQASANTVNIDDERAAEAPSEDIAETELSKQDSDLVELRLNWSRNFLEREGFQFVIQQIYALDVENSDVKQIDFMLTLVRVFLTAAFATDQNKEIGQAVRLTRKSSSIDDNDPTNKPKKEDKKDKLQQLLLGEFGMEILLTTNYARLQQKILTLVFNILQKEQLSLEEKIIIENSMTIWVGSSLYKPELFNDFLAFKSGDSTIEDFILSGLIYCREDKIRQDFCQGILALVKSFGQEKSQQAKCFFMGILGKNFAVISSRPVGQYFDLFNQLIDLSVMSDCLVDEISDQSIVQATYDPETLLPQIIEKIIQNHQSSKSSDNDAKQLDEVAVASNERLLIGLITLTSQIIQTADSQVCDRIIQEKNLINLIFQEFLFVSYFKAQEDKNSQETKKEIKLIQREGSKKNESQKVTVSNNKSREAAYSLLIQLVKQSGSLMESFLKNVLMPMLETVSKPKGWAYQPPSKEGGEGRIQEYVGLRNLGCICYMNSMLQQFFMIPAFRYNLLCVEDGKASDIQEYKGRWVDDNMFHQMQKLFTNLELSERMDYNPFGFCFAFKEFDGSPTNTGEQKDAQEFLNLLFDRLETALKPTSRKYLLQGIFGGKQCSQMVCTECGKVKNRQEDFLNLSLNIKDVKSVYQSLEKLVEGEIISDYQCDGCNRKVDLSKRTLIAETPNILVLHLQRIGFNFETFETDKVNTLCKFPTVLDLKPYSFFEVMGKENRLKEQQTQSDKNPSKVKEEEEAMTEEELEKKREREEEIREPIKDDCFEYKLVGVNVHSGSANMGHYWSYINTNRGTDEKEGDTNWIKTENDPWMEFNDSRVTDWDFKDIEKQCFGNEPNTGFMGDSYGTSGYMLFYERRVKKNLKILIEEDKVEEEEKKGYKVYTDEEQKEKYKLVPYRDAAKDEKAIPFYQQVFEDNHNVNFENDIYSQEFFDFVLKIMKDIARMDSSSSKELGLQIGKKVGFDILSHCYDNAGLTHLSSVLIDILKSSDQACLEFMQTLLDEDDAEPVMEILFDCPDKISRKYLIRIIRYLVCRLKEIEKESILANLVDTVTETCNDIYGEQVTRQRSEPRALVLKFMQLLKLNMPRRAARSWKIIDNFMDILLTFGVQSAEDVENEIGQTKQAWSRDSVGYLVGMTEYLRSDFLTLIGDFILQENSPLYRMTEYRIQMGNYYIQPDFEKALLLITIMMSESQLTKKFPLSQDAQSITQSKSILQAMIKAQDNQFGEAGVDFSEMMNLMCFNNIFNTKKMAKSYLRELLNKNQVEDIQKGVKTIREFLLIKDQLRLARFEWIFGVPQIIAKKQHQKKVIQVGLEAIDFINQEAYQFKSGVVKGAGDALLTDMFKAQKTRVEFTIYALLELINLCIEDEEICQYIYNLPPATYQFTRYSDWFEPFAKEQREHLLEQSQRYTVFDMQSRENINVLTQILSLLPTYKQKCAKFESEWKQMREDASLEDFEGYKNVSMVGENEEVVDHYPPLYIIGQPVEELTTECYVEEQELVTVRMYKLTAEYIWSNPTGKYNLSIPDKKLRNHLNFKAREQSYVEWKKSQAPDAANQDEAINMDEEEEDEFAGQNVRQWHEHSGISEVLIKIEVENNSREMVKVEIGIQAEEGSDPNCHIPLTSYYTQLYAKNISVRPCCALLQKIDPSKPFGQFKITVGAKRGKTNFSSVGRGNNTQGGYGGYSQSSTTGIDPTSQAAFRDVVHHINNDNGNPRTVGFFVTGTNIDQLGQGNMINEVPQTDTFNESDDDQQLGGEDGQVFSDKGETGETSPTSGLVNLLNDDMLEMQDIGSDGMGNFDDVSQPPNQ